MPERALTDWVAAAERLRWPAQLLVDGARRPPLDGETRALVTPRDGTELARVPWGGGEDIEAAVAAARRAFDEGPWPRMAPSERKVVLLRFAELIEANRDELALMVTLEMGKPIAQSWSIELRAVLASYRYYAELADKELDEIAPTGQEALALVTREPVGVVGVVTPWNFPLTLSAWKIAPALAFGCTVVHKPADLTPLSAVRIAELALEAGVPAGVLNVVPGRGSVLGRRIGEHPAVDALAFTGSTAVGREYLRYAAESNLKRTWLELGGKSPNIILPDAERDRAIATAAWGITFNAGQMCTAPSRLIVHEEIAEEVLDGVVRACAGYRPGDPLDPATTMGPLAAIERAAAVDEHVDRAFAEGATAALDARGGTGAYYGPVVCSGVEAASRLAREEVFGPVLAVQRASDVDEAVRLANDSEYGLAAGLWTRDVTAVHRISRRLRAGTVWVNCYEEGDLGVPFGGYKQSGNGRDKSRHAIEKYTELKTTYLQL
ncbi:aldehyde dehydrogenase family protein [Sciscionella marina]|uniref:aldehyde dehydrogenase family protein n=1 Tax=Sciscionella marina TaxID=508770 RepID=UPI0003606E3B|nr:aldehyde dehydrogenase family protein [Sciscionella marina]